MSMVLHDTQCTTVQVEMKHQKILALDQKLLNTNHGLNKKSPLYFRAILCCSYHQPHFKGDKNKVQRNTQLVISREKKNSNL